MRMAILGGRLHGGLYLRVSSGSGASARRRGGQLGAIGAEGDVDRPLDRGMTTEEEADQMRALWR